MILGFAGMTHLGRAHAQAAEIMGHEVRRDEKFDECDLVFVTQDVEKPADEAVVWDVAVNAIGNTRPETPVIIVSQVMPGFTRKLLGIKPKKLYYQLDTIIMNDAVNRVLHPDYMVVGSEVGLDVVYLQYLREFYQPELIVTSYESAEMCKLAINCHLAASVASANAIAVACRVVNARSHDVFEVMKLDERIGPKSYLEEGPIGGHLPRDVRRLQSILFSALFDAVEAQCEK